MKRTTDETLASVIKFEGKQEDIIWKHHIQDFNSGTQLIVHESQEAIFFRDGKALDLFGPGRYTLETQQIPLLENLYGTLTDPDGTFHSEIYFINLTTLMAIKWGTDSKVRLFDPHSGLPIELGAGGEFNIRVTNARKLLLKTVGTTGGLLQDQLLGSDKEKGLFRSMIITQVKTYLAQTIKDLNISILEIDAHLLELSNELRTRINVFLENYGLEIPEFFVSRIVTPDDDPNFRKLKQQFAEQYLLVRQEEIKKREAMAMAERMSVEAQTKAHMKVISAQGEAEALKIQKLAEAETYKMQAEAEAVAMKMKGYSYQQETAREVGLAAMQNGLSSGSGNGIGDVAGLGVALGAMSGIMGATKEVLDPVFSTAFGSEAKTPPISGTQWTCTCGQQNPGGNFCLNCGTKKGE